MVGEGVETGWRASLVDEGTVRWAHLYRFHARGLHVVMGPAAPKTLVQFRILIDGQAPHAANGVDVDDQGNGTITVPRRYQLIRQPTPIPDRQFEIQCLNAGAKAFSFTFG